MQTILIEVDDEVADNAQKYTLPQGWRLMSPDRPDITATDVTAFKGLSECGEEPAYRLAVKLFKIKGVQKVQMNSTSFIVTFDPKLIGLYVSQDIVKALYVTYLETVLIMPDLLSTRNMIRGLSSPGEHISDDVCM